MGVKLLNVGKRRITSWLCDCIHAGGQLHHTADNTQFPVHCDLPQGGVLLPCWCTNRHLLWGKGRKKYLTNFINTLHAVGHFSDPHLCIRNAEDHYNTLMQAVMYMFTTTRGQINLSIEFRSHLSTYSTIQEMQEWVVTSLWVAVKLTMAVKYEAVSRAQAANILWLALNSQKSATFVGWLQTRRNMS